MKYLFGFGLCIVFALFFLVSPVSAFPADNLSSTLSGKILLDVENNGEAWYVYPGDFHRYYLGTPADAYNIMSNLSLGISNTNFLEVSSSTPDKFRGLILLKPEDAGRVYYVHPVDKSLNYMADGAGAYELMRKFSLGITAEDLKSIPVGKIILDDQGKEINREWQNLGWWSKINKKSIDVMEGPSSNSKILGKLYLNNTVKVLDIAKGDGRVWYQIDGGQYQGAFLDASFVNPMPQPSPAKKVIIPSTVKQGDYWVDMNISKRILTLYQDDKAIMTTYVSLGDPLSPTFAGTYNVWLKLKKTRMAGGPPLATHEYDLANVQWVMYYNRSFALHGTYWHDNFGAFVSAGCTNLTNGDAKFIFDLTNPVMGEETSVFSTAENFGMVVYNHY